MSSLAVASGVIPILSHCFAGYAIFGSIKQLSNFSSLSPKKLIDIRDNIPQVRNHVAVSLARDILAIAIIATLACLSILTPMVAIIVGSVLLASVLLSIVSIGLTSHLLSRAQTK